MALNTLRANFRGALSEVSSESLPGTVCIEGTRAQGEPTQGGDEVRRGQGRWGGLHYVAASTL